MKSGCPACENKNVISNSYESFHSRFSGPFIKRYDLKFGQIEQCEICKMNWYVDKREYWVNTISDDRMQSVLHWNEKQLKIKPEYLKILLEIGCPPSDYSSRGFLEIPCKCTLDNGMILENTIVSIQSKPPVGMSYHNVEPFFFIDQVIKIEHSNIALPLNIRLETANAGEMRMGYAPTAICAPNNQIYVLNGPMRFFNEDGFGGNEMKISRADLRNPKVGIASKNIILGVRIIADWSNEIEMQFKKHIQKSGT
ncbi:MAG: hypothetical protein ABIQ40_01095 [Bacteroidia bacterium]